MLNRWATQSQVTLTVDSVNDVPTAQADAYDATEDTQLIISAQSGVLEKRQRRRWGHPQGHCWKRTCSMAP